MIAVRIIAVSLIKKSLDYASYDYGLYKANGDTADDNESLRFVDRILAIGFRIAKDLPPETISRAWMSKDRKFVQLNSNRLPYEYAMDSSSEEPALSQESNRKLLLSFAVTPFLVIFSIFQLI